MTDLRNYKKLSEKNTYGYLTFRRNGAISCDISIQKWTVQIYQYLIPKLAMLTLSAHLNLWTVIILKNVSTLWNFYCSPTFVFVLWLSVYVAILNCHLAMSEWAFLLHATLSIIWNRDIKTTVRPRWIFNVIWTHLKPEFKENSIFCYDLFHSDVYIFTKFCW